MRRFSKAVRITDELIPVLKHDFWLESSLRRYKDVNKTSPYLAALRPAETLMVRGGVASRARLTLLELVVGTLGEIWVEGSRTRLLFNDRPLQKKLGPRQNVSPTPAV